MSVAARRSSPSRETIVSTQISGRRLASSITATMFSPIFRAQVALQLIRGSPLLDQREHVRILDVLIHVAGEAAATDPGGLEQATEDAMHLVALVGGGADAKTPGNHDPA